MKRKFDSMSAFSPPPMVTHKEIARFAGEVVDAIAELGEEIVLLFRGDDHLKAFDVKSFAPTRKIDTGGHTEIVAVRTHAECVVVVHSGEKFLRVVPKRGHRFLKAPFELMPFDAQPVAERRLLSDGNKLYYVSYPMVVVFRRGSFDRSFYGLRLDNENRFFAANGWLHVWNEFYVRMERFFFPLDGPVRKSETSLPPPPRHASVIRGADCDIRYLTLSRETSLKDAADCLYYSESIRLQCETPLGRNKSWINLPGGDFDEVDLLPKNGGSTVSLKFEAGVFVFSERESAQLLFFLDASGKPLRHVSHPSSCLTAACVGDSAVTAHEDGRVLKWNGGMHYEAVFGLFLCWNKRSNPVWTLPRDVVLYIAEAHFKSIEGETVKADLRRT